MTNLNHNLKIYLRNCSSPTYVEARNVQHITSKSLYKEMDAQEVALKDLVISPRYAYFFSGDTSITINGKDILAIASEVNHD